MTTNITVEDLTKNNLSPDDLSKEERELFEQRKQKMFTAMSRMRINPIKANHQPMTTLSKFNARNVLRALQSPVTNAQFLRQLSEFLYNTSPEYRLIIDFKSSLLQYKYTISPNFIMDDRTDLKAMNNAKLKLSYDLEKMALPHELSKVVKVAYKQDTFYGYEVETKDSYFIQNINPDLCMITSREDGIFNFSFDFSHFDSNPQALGFYPEEFRVKYMQYRNSGQNWLELNSEKTLVLKVNEEVEYQLIPFAILFERLFDLDEYRKLEKAKAMMDNYLILTQRIPLKKDAKGMDDFAISEELAMDFHDLLSEALQDGIGLLTSPMEIDSIKSEKSTKDSKAVEKAVSDVFGGAGIPASIFNPQNGTNAVLNKSLIADDAVAFRLLRQIERWLNRKLKNRSGRYKFKVEFLDTTLYNMEEVIKKYTSAAQAGFQTHEQTLAMLNISYMDFHNTKIIEKSEYSMRDSLIPLATAHTMSSSDREALSEDEAAESTIVNRDNETDLNKE